MYKLEKVVENLVRAFPEYKHDFSNVRFIAQRNLMPRTLDINVSGDIVYIENKQTKGTIIYDNFLSIPTKELGIIIDEKGIFIGDILYQYVNYDFLEGLCAECPMTPGLYKMLSCIYEEAWINNMTLTFTTRNIPMPKLGKLL